MQSLGEVEKQNNVSALNLQRKKIQPTSPSSLQDSLQHWHDIIRDHARCPILRPAIKDVQTRARPDQHLLTRARHRPIDKLKRRSLSPPPHRGRRHCSTSTCANLRRLLRSSLLASHSAALPTLTPHFLSFVHGHLRPPPPPDNPVKVFNLGSGYSTPERTRIGQSIGRIRYSGTMRFCCRMDTHSSAARGWLAG